MGMLCVLSFAYAQGPNGSGTYYSGADGKCGSELKTALYNIIKNPEVIGYSDLWQAYKETDVTSSGYIWDMYSNTTQYVPGGIYQGANITGKVITVNTRFLKAGLEARLRCIRISFISFPRMAM